MPLKNLNLKLLLPGNVSLYTSYQRWLIRQRLLISTLLPTFASSCPWYAAPPNSYVQKLIIPGCTGIKRLFSLQFFFILYTFWMIPTIPHHLCTNLIHASFSTRKYIKTFEYRIHWNINIRKNKFLYEKINGSVGWNKHSGEQH